jgi:hypothetical protein
MHFLEVIVKTRVVITLTDQGCAAIYFMAHRPICFFLLNALIIRLRLGTDHSLDTTGTRQPLVEETIYDLEQDGFLRKHDVAGILWPTGYLLSLCLAAPRACGVPELYQAVKTATTNATLSPALAVELGAGYWSSFHCTCESFSM